MGVFYLVVSISMPLTVNRTRNLSMKETDSRCVCYVLSQTCHLVETVHIEEDQQ